LGGVDGKPKLFETDPSGSFWEYKATAIGENIDKVKDLLQKGYKEEMGLEQAIELGLKALYKGTNERFNERSIEIVYIDMAGKFHNLTPEQIKENIMKVIGNVKKGKK
jgi:proteasome alpha subunit